MAELLRNYVAGKWVEGNSEGTLLTDPVTGEGLVRVSSDGLDLRATGGEGGGGVVDRWGVRV